MMIKILRHGILALLLTSATDLLAQQTNAGEDYTAYLPEVRAFNHELANIPKGPSLLTKEGLAMARAPMLLTGSPYLRLHPSVKMIQGPAGKLGLRIFRPDTIQAVVLEIHGGGWTVGTAASDDGPNEEMARRCKVAVVSVDYRLAPEHAFPASVDDCKSAAKWLIDNAMKEFGTDRLFISGASAGAHLAALTTLYIRDSLHAISRVKGVNLVYGCFDLSRTPSSLMATDSTLMINKTYLEETYQLVFPGWSIERLRDSRYSPLYADLKGLPPALFTIGTRDPLVDDTYFMEARWRSAGNKTFLAVYPESSHAFNFFPSRMARVANERMYEWIIGLCR